MTADLAAWLLQQLAEDEAVAPEAASVLLIINTERCARIGSDEYRTYLHFDRHGPNRVLARCEADRAIVEAWRLTDAHVQAVALSSPDEARDARNTRLGLQIAMQLLALPYADRPGYLEEWKP
jgi:hypothetical protein